MGPVLLIAGMFFSTGCSDSFLQMDSPNQPSSGTFWKNERDAKMALTACYDALQAGSLYNENVDGWQFGVLMRETCTDNGDNTWGQWMLGSSIVRCISSTTDDQFKFYWNANYEAVKRCNLLIENIDRVEMPQEKRDIFKAEAIAIRALMYNNLTTMYRDVPYLTKPLTLQEAKAGKTSKADIVSELIKDLDEWLPKLPAIGVAEPGRMTQEAGYAILGRIALYNKMWDKAIEAYDNVIGKVSLFKSGDGTNHFKNYADLFTVENETAPEVLLSVHYQGPGFGEGNGIGICWGMPMNAIEASMNLCDDYYCIDGKPISKSPLFKGSLEKGAHTKAHPDFARYENRDPRMKATLMLPGMDWNGKVYDYSSTSTQLPATSTACIRKWFNPADQANEADGSLDFYLIRYAEVLLSIAEAKIERGDGQADVTPYINEVRSRVGMPSVEVAEGEGLDQSQLREIVRHERRIELAFEAHRLEDLYRWNEFEASLERMKHDKEFYGFGAVPRGSIRGAQDYVWPIPQAEIDTNDMLEQHEEWL